MEPKKFEYIDSLRGVAILLVILMHSGYYLHQNMEFFPKILTLSVFYAQYGVQLFFIVSAYTLMMSYYSRINEDNKTVKFFIRRYMRIAPMFYLGLVLNLLTRQDITEISWLRVLSNVTFTNSFGEYHDGYVPGGWTISVEFIFYLILPFLCTKIKSLNSALFLFTSVLLITTIYEPIILQLGLDNFKISYFSIFYQLPIFALGICLYWLLNDKNKIIERKTLFLLLITIITCCYISFPTNVGFSLAFVCLVLIMMFYPHKIYTNKFLANIGKVSFSMYIIHFFVIDLLNSFNASQFIKVTSFPISMLNFIIMYLIVFLITFLLSNISYKLIEIPGQDLGRKLIKKINPSKS